MVKDSPVHVTTQRRHYVGKDGMERVYETHLLRRSFREDGKVRLLAGSGGFGRVPAWGSGCRPARVVTFRSPVLRDWSNVGNPGSVQDGFGVGRAVAGDPLGFRRGAGPAGSVPGFPAGRAFRVFGGGLR